MGALSPQAKALVPEEFIGPNASMNAAFAKLFAGLWNAPMSVALYIAARYGDAAAALLALNEHVTAVSDHDRELVDAWEKQTRLEEFSAARLVQRSDSTERTAA